MPHPQVVEEEHVSYERERGHRYDVMEYGVQGYGFHFSHYKKLGNCILL